PMEGAMVAVGESICMVHYLAGLPAEPFVRAARPLQCPSLPLWRAAQGFISDLLPPFSVIARCGHDGKSAELCTGTMHSSRTRRPWGERTPDPWTAFLSVVFPDQRADQVAADHSHVDRVAKD